MELAGGPGIQKPRGARIGVQSNRRLTTLVRPMARVAPEVPLIRQSSPQSIGTNYISGGVAVAGPKRGTGR